MPQRLGLAPRLAILGAFNVAVYVSYITIIKRSRERGGSFERDGYDFWSMWGPPRHVHDSSKVTHSREA
eukprot:jgi/Mesen1/908/ME000116S00054